MKSLLVVLLVALVPALACAELFPKAETKTECVQCGGIDRSKPFPPEPANEMVCENGVCKLRPVISFNRSVNKVVNSGTKEVTRQSGACFRRPTLAPKRSISLEQLLKGLVPGDEVVSIKVRRSRMEMVPSANGSSMVPAKVLVEEELPVNYVVPAAAQPVSVCPDCPVNVQQCPPPVYRQAPRRVQQGNWPPQTVQRQPVFQRSVQRSTSFNPVRRSVSTDRRFGWRFRAVRNRVFRPRVTSQGIRRSHFVGGSGPVHQPPGQSLAWHLRNEHGVNTNGMSYQQMLAIHTQIHR